MKSFLLTFLTTLFISSTFAQHDGHTGMVNNAKAIELGSHRVGRLVDTGKVEEKFLTGMNQITLEKISFNSPTAPAFKIAIKQAANSEGNRNELTMLLDMKGKFVSYIVSPKVTGASEISWPDSPVSELVEAAMHYLTEASPAGIDLKPFKDQMKALTINQKILEDSTVQASMIVETSSSSAKLEILMSSTGQVLGTAVIAN